MNTIEYSFKSLLNYNHIVKIYIGPGQDQSLPSLAEAGLIFIIKHRPGYYLNNSSIGLPILALGNGMCSKWLSVGAISVISYAV